MDLEEVKSMGHTFEQVRLSLQESGAVSGATRCLCSTGKKEAKESKVAADSPLIVQPNVERAVSAAETMDHLMGIEEIEPLGHTFVQARASLQSAASLGDAVKSLQGEGTVVKKESKYEPASEEEIMKKFY